MARNVEIKAKVSDLSLPRARLAKLNGQDSYSLSQIDTFFNAPLGRLKLREFGDGAAELISYHRADQSGPKLCDYERVACKNPKELGKTLAKSLGIRGVVIKKRQVTLIGRTRVHLDEVEGLGSFVELEVVLDRDEPVSVGERVVADLLRELGIPQSCLRSAAYIDLLEEAK
jgi:predicted adenylyl cyclase CyaB